MLRVNDNEEEFDFEQMEKLLGEKYQDFNFKGFG